MKAEDFKKVAQVYDMTDEDKYVKITLKSGEKFLATAINYTETDTETEEDVIAVRVMKEDGTYATIAGAWIESVEEIDKPE